MSGLPVRGVLRIACPAVEFFDQLALCLIGTAEIRLRNVVDGYLSRR